MKRYFFLLYYKLYSQAKLLLVKGILYLRSFRVEETMLIFGEPRSGSTWLMELLMNIPKRIVIWEPLHPKLGISFLQKGGGRKFLLPHKSKDKTIQFEQLLTLKSCNSWTLNYASIKSLWRGEATLAKFVRGSLLLPWVVQQFSLKYSPILIVRHPAAMVLSQLTGKLNFQAEMPDKETLKYLYPEAYEQYFAYLGTLKEPLYQGFALWCVVYKYLLEHPLQEQWQLVFYEHMLLNPAQEMAEIGQKWQEELNIPSEKLRKASKTDFRNQLKAAPEEQLHKWQKEFSSDICSKLQEILDFFVIKHYRMNTVLPEIEIK